MTVPKISVTRRAAPDLSSDFGNLDISSLKSGNIPGINGLRAISVLLVMLAHYGFGDRIPGGLGVTIFFFISGFLITTLMFREAAGTGTVSIRNFYIRRFLRLQPELFAYVILSALIGITYIGIPSFADFAAAFLYMTNYYNLAASSGLMESHLIRWPQLWSLAIEEHYYLTYPLLFASCIRAPKRLLMAITLICVVLLAWRSVLIWNGISSLYTYLATDTRLDSIAFGCLGALMLWRFDAALVVHPRLLKLALPLGAAIILASLAPKSDAFRETVRYSVQGVGLLMIFLGLFTPLGQRAALFLDMPPLRWMGRMSYAAYLWHVEWIYAAEYFLGPNITKLGHGSIILFALAGCAATFATAALSHYYIYRPVLTLRRRYGSHAAI
jgi:peptidoglycan/LPS O-acetylase OafA/YrhL